MCINSPSTETQPKPNRNPKTHQTPTASAGAASAASGTVSSTGVGSLMRKGTFGSVKSRSARSRSFAGKNRSTNGSTAPTTTTAPITVMYPASSRLTSSFGRNLKQRKRPKRTHEPTSGNRMASADDMRSWGPAPAPSSSERSERQLPTYTVRPAWRTIERL